MEAEEKQFDRVLKIGLDLRRSLEAGKENLQGSSFDRRADERSASTSMKPLAFRWTSWSMRRAMPTFISIDAGFEAARAEEQARARASWKGGSQKIGQPRLSRTDEDRVPRVTNN